MERYKDSLVKDTKKRCPETLVEKLRVRGVDMGLLEDLLRNMLKLEPAVTVRGSFTTSLMCPSSGRKRLEKRKDSPCVSRMANGGCLKSERWDLVKMTAASRVGQTIAANQVARWMDRTFAERR